MILGPYSILIEFKKYFMICFYKKTLINAGIRDPAITVLGNGFGKI